MRYLCPVCEKKKTKIHFACGFGAKGGKAKGARKARDPEQYREMSRKSVETRRANRASRLAEAQKGKEAP